MKYSVIITCKNREKFISRCIRSALNQKQLDRHEYEVIVIDDFSKDGSKKLILDYQNVIKHHFNKKNLGLSISRNIGLKLAKGKYVFMLDSDDYITDDTLNFLGLCLDYNKKWSAVACDYFTVNYSGKKLKRYSFEKKPIACGILYRKSQLFKIGLYNSKLKMMEDKDLMIRFKKKFEMGYLAVPLYRYTMHSKNMTKNKSMKKKYNKILKTIHG